ncbi:MAG TPA: HigA family addiction module antitoxin [Acetobacteraceae bacterium]
MPMKNPPHPGLSGRHDCIAAHDMTITGAAEVLGVKRQTLNNLVNGKSGISADMAIRLDKAFGGGAETAAPANGLRPGASSPARGRHQRKAGAWAQAGRPAASVVDSEL